MLQTREQRAHIYCDSQETTMQPAWALLEGSGMSEGHMLLTKPTSVS